MFTGNIVAAIASMDGKDNVCRTSLKKLIDCRVASSTPAIVSVGTTGKPATLSHDEHADIVMMMLELADGRIPVIAGTGANATAETISLTQRFNDGGIVGCLTVTLYYNRPSQEGLYQYFKTIAEHTDLPQILYNMPSHTGCDLPPEMVGRLAKVKDIIGIKKATGNLARVNQIKELVSGDFVLLSGDNTSVLGFMQLDSHGVISITADVAARDVAQMCKLTVEGHFAEARVINQRLMPSHNKLFIEPNPIPVEWVRRELSLVTTDMLRLLMISITDSGRETVRAAPKHAGLL